MSYVTRLINNVNKQVSENGEPRQVDFNIQSLKKAMTSFRDFNDEYVENLEDSDEIDRAFTTLLSTEDKFQQCIEAAESYLAQCRRKPVQIVHRENLGSIQCLHRAQEVTDANHKTPREGEKDITLQNVQQNLIPEERRTSMVLQQQ